MSNYIDWKVRIRRVNKNNLIEESDLKLFSSCVGDGGYFEEDDFYEVSTSITAPNRYIYFECNFHTESWNAYYNLNTALRDFTADHPEYLCQTEATDYDSMQYWRTNFANGRMEHMEGYIVYPEPKEVLF